MLIPIFILQFPTIKLETEDAAKLRGYMGWTFKEHSDLFHNHLGEDKFSYKYPSIQYKIVNNIPVIVGINEGASILSKLHTEIKTIHINDRTYPVVKRFAEEKNYKIGVAKELNQYMFVTDWMGLNQDNFSKFILLRKEDQFEMLKKVLIGNILSFFKTQNLFITEKIKMEMRTKERTTIFKGKKMISFTGSFITNALLPDYIGLGKSVSGGYGTILKTKFI